MAHFGTAEQEEKVDASMLRSMGFPEADVREALRRTKDDVNRALDLLTAATMPDEDAFDILATHPAAYDDGRRKPFQPARPDPDKKDITWREAALYIWARWVARPSLFF